MLLVNIIKIKLKLIREDDKVKLGLMANRSVSL